MGENSCESMRQKKLRMATFSTWEAATLEHTHIHVHIRTHTHTRAFLSSPMQPINDPSLEHLHNDKTIHNYYYNEFFFFAP